MKLFFKFSASLMVGALTIIGASTPVTALPQDILKATVVDTVGSVRQMPAAGGHWLTINVGDTLSPQTTLQTGESSAALLQLNGDHMMRIGAGTRIVLKQLGDQKAFSFNLIAGRVWSFVKRASSPAKYEIETPSAVVGVSGTVFSVFHDPGSNQTDVTTSHGSVGVRQGDAAQVNVTDGNSLVATAAGLGQVIRQSPKIRQMWNVLNRTESWVHGSATSKLNRAVERAMPAYRSAIHRGNQNVRGDRGPGEKRKRIQP